VKQNHPNESVHYFNDGIVFELIIQLVLTLKRLTLKDCTEVRFYDVVYNFSSGQNQKDGMVLFKKKYF
jgi:hypothetical protein